MRLWELKLEEISAQAGSAGQVKAFHGPPFSGHGRSWEDYISPPETGRSCCQTRVSLGRERWQIFCVWRFSFSFPETERRVTSLKCSTKSSATAPFVPLGSPGLGRV
eukprot:scaffold5576_cov107-Cylindrotheca_fusiformis.AAC.4